MTLNPLALYDFIDFDAWLNTIIPAELSFSGPKYLPFTPNLSHGSTKIIRRRMALLIGAWVGTKCAEALRPKVYELLLSLLTPLDTRNDVVVRMSAATALQCAVDEWQFKPEDFLTYLEAFLIGTCAEEDKGGIIGLMAFVGHIEARMRLVRVVEVIVERMDRRVFTTLCWKLTHIDYSVCAFDHEFVAIFVGAKSRATDIQSGGAECPQDDNWGISSATM